MATPAHSFIRISSKKYLPLFSLFPGVRAGASEHAHLFIKLLQYLVAIRRGTSQALRGLIVCLRELRLSMIARESTCHVLVEGHGGVAVNVDVDKRIQVCEGVTGR